MQNNDSMVEFVKQLFKDKLPATYYYHNFEHTVFVIKKTIEIARQEKCSSEEIALLQIGALWHDVGFINKYLNHEEEGCLLVKKYLPQYGYNNDDINMICDFIMATKIPQSPKTKLQEILADADLAYLGTKSAASKAKLLYKELHYMDSSLTEKKFIEIQISFIKNHEYFTAYCQNKMEKGKKEYLKMLIEKL